MPRKPRFFLPGVPAHIVQRGRSREQVFFEPRDYRCYLQWLTDAAERYRCAVHAYVLMSNHVHILATPDTKTGLSRMMQYIGGRYTPYMNQCNDTTGSIWEGRFRGSLVEDECYLLTCMRYIELNPVRARMVRSPEQYSWSSYRANALGKKDRLLTPHALYRNMGDSDHIRQERYGHLFEGQFDDELAEDIQIACETGTPLGNKRFRAELENTLNRTTGSTKRGRPRKPQK